MLDIEIFILHFSITELRNFPAQWCWVSYNCYDKARSVPSTALNCLPKQRSRRSGFTVEKEFKLLRLIHKYHAVPMPCFV